MQTTEDFSVGVPVIDKGQRELATVLKNLQAAIKAQVCRYTIENTLAFLEEYIEVHFLAEELYMKHYGYADYRFHEEKHRQFATEFNFLKEELRNIRTLGLKGSYELSVETVQVIADWISAHVLQDDKKLGEFMRHRSYATLDAAVPPCGGAERVTGGIVTMCSICHKIRGKKGLWKKREDYEEIPSDVLFSHGICPECLQLYYTDLFEEKR